MKFKKYNSIENSYRTKFLECMQEEGLDGGEFIVQEKVHGANFSFWVNGTHARMAKRSDFVESGFYNSQAVLKKYYDKLMKAYQLVKESHPEMEVLTIYGELLGGAYPHDDVERDKTATKVQKGVYYCPHNDFFAFDLAVDGKLIAIDKAVEIFEELELIHAKTLFKGSLSQCLEYPKLFQTTVPELWNLPEIPDNICEGVVIKPNDPRFLGGGSRVILKNKNEKFAEKAKEKNRTPEEPLSSDAARYLNIMCSYVTENRLKNVLSKIGTVTQKDFGKVMKDMNADYMEEFLKDNTDYDLISKEDKKRIQKQANRTASTLIRDNFLKIIDGNF